MINTFDIDGVIFFGGELTGVRPHPKDIIITGRSFEEEQETSQMLIDYGIYNSFYMNPLPKFEKTRKTSGIFKGNMIRELMKTHEIGIHFEDDEIQIEEIRKIVPELKIVHLVHNLTVK